MSKFVRFLRFIFITILWSLFYFGLARKYFMSVEGFAGFDILRKSHWLDIYYQWIDGWVITSGVEHLFFFSVVLLLPIWALVLWGLIVFDFTAFVKGKIAARKKRIEKMKAEEALYNPPKIPVYRDPEKYRRRPVPLRALSGTEFKENKKSKDKGQDDKQHPSKNNVAVEKVKETKVTDIFDDEIMSEEDIISGKSLTDKEDTLPDFDTKPNEKKMNDIIPGATVEEILDNAGYKVLKKLNINDDVLDFLAVADDKLLVIKCFDDEGQWLADEVPFREEDPQWFSEISQKTSPVRIVTVMAEYFDDKVDEKYDIIPILIVSKANIMNAEEIAKSWEELHVIVGVIDDGGPRNILPEAGAAIMPAEKTASDSDFSKIKAIFNQ